MKKLSLKLFLVLAVFTGVLTTTLPLFAQSLIIPAPDTAMKNSPAITPADSEAGSRIVGQDNPHWLDPDNPSYYSSGDRIAINFTQVKR